MKSIESFWKVQRRKVCERNKLALDNGKLVHKVVHRMTTICREPYEDLYQIGYIGLLKAAERYDYTSGNAFSSFAIPYIQGEIQHYLRDQWQVVKIPRNLLEIRSKVKRLKKRLSQLGREVDELEIALALGLSKRRWQEISEIDSNLSVSLDVLIHEPANYEENEESLDDLLYKCISNLEAKSRNAILEKFFVGKSIEEIARNNCLTPEEINAHLKLGLRKIKTTLEIEEFL